LSLEGKIIAITRPEKQSNELADLVSKLEGKPYVAPTLEIKPKQDKRLIKRLLNKILDGEIDFLVFLSINGVKILFEFVEEMELKAKFLEALRKVSVIAIGPKTRMELEKNGITVDLVPRKYSSEGIIESLREMDLRKKTVAIPRSNKSSQHLGLDLKKMGANVLEVPVYEYAFPEDQSRVLALINNLLQEKVDAITFTSSSTAVNLFKIAREHVSIDDFTRCLRKTVVVAIGPTTKRTLEELGVKVDVVPEEYTIQSMMDSLVEYSALGRNTSRAK